MLNFGEEFLCFYDFPCVKFNRLHVGMKIFVVGLYSLACSFLSLNMRMTTRLLTMSLALTVIRFSHGGVPSISVPGLDPASNLSPGSVSYQAPSNVFSLDVGELGNAAKTLSQPLGVNQPADFGMVSEEFLLPSVSYTRNITAYVPPDMNIKGCKPSTNNGGCPKGGEARYNIALPSPLRQARTNR